MNAGGFLEVVAPWALAVTVLAFALVASRIVRGPTLPDRIMALDLIGVIMVAGIALIAVIQEAPVLLDVSIALAVVSFLSTLAFAKFIERRARQRAREDAGPSR